MRLAGDWARWPSPPWCSWPLDAVLRVPGDRPGVRAVLYRRALAVSLQPLRHTGARDEAA